MANGRYTRSGGNIFTPQTPQHDIGADILQAMMREKGMRDQREAQIMEFARQMNPVKFMHNKLMLWQNDKINAIEDGIASMMEEKTGKPSGEDMLNVQFKINNFREEQQYMLGIQDVLAKESAVYSDPKNVGVYSQSEMATRTLNFVTKFQAPKGGTFLVKNPLNFSEFVANFNPIPKDRFGIEERKDFTDASRENVQTVTKKIFGDYTKGSPLAGTKDDPLWIPQREQAMAHELMYNDALMEGARIDYNDPDIVSDEERAMWDNMAMTERTTASSIDRDKQGNIVTFPDGAPLDGAYYWGVHQAYKIQPTTGKNVIAMTPQTDIDRMNKRAGEGDETETATTEWVGEGSEIERTVGFPSKSGTKNVTYVSEDKAILNVKVGGVNGVRVKLDGDYFVTANAEYKDEYIGGSINDKAFNEMSGTSYKLAHKPEIEVGMPVYVGEDIVLEEFVTKDMGRKGKVFGGDEGMKFVRGMPIDKETLAALKEEAKTNTKAQEILDKIDKKNVARLQLETGTRENAEVMRIYDEVLAKELGTKFFEYGVTQPEEPKSGEDKYGNIFNQ